MENPSQSSSQEDSSSHSHSQHHHQPHQALSPKQPTMGHKMFDFVKVGKTKELEEIEYPYEVTKYCDLLG